MLRDKPAHRPELPTRLDVRVGEYGFWQLENVPINIWLQPPRVHSVRSLIRLTEAMLPKHPNGVSAIHYVEPRVQMPDAPTRVAMAELSKISEPALRAVAVVMTGSGFWASSVQSALTGIRIVSGVEFRFRFSAHVEDLLTWFPAEHRAQTGITLARGTLDTAVTHAIAETRGLQLKRWDE